MMRKSPGFTAAAVLTLALGIGANCAIFSVVYGVLLRPLPYPDPERLVALQGAPTHLSGGGLTPENLLDWKDRIHTVEQLALYNIMIGGINLTGSGAAERIDATEVSVDFFTTLGVRPVRGRTFLTEEGRSGKGDAVIVSYGLWKRLFGSDPNLIGQTVALSGKSFRVVGVAPEGFSFPEGADLWLPVAGPTERILRGAVYQVIGRLRPDASLDQARAEITAFIDARIQELNRQNPGRKFNIGPVSVVPVQDQLVKAIRKALLVLFGAVGFVLLIACANVTNLLLARADGRQKEIAIRAALGASRFRLIRQLLAESLVLAAASCALGILVAAYGIRLLVLAAPTEIPRLAEVHLDIQVLAFAVAVSLLTGILFGSAPAWQAARVNLTAAFKESTPWKVGARLGGLRHLLVVAEIALALVLMVGAGLLIRSLLQLYHAGTGFTPQNVLSLAIDLPRSAYPRPAQRAAFYQQLLERLAVLPGVERVGATSNLPLGKTSAYFLVLFAAEGKPPAEKFQDQFAGEFTVSADYFGAMGITLVRGRPFTRQEVEAAAPVLIINQTMAQRVWPNEDPIGRRLKISPESAPREIVGVVSDIRNWGLEQKPLMETYQPGLANLSAVAIKTSPDPFALVELARREVQAIDRRLPLYDVKTMEQRLSSSMAQRRFLLIMLAIFATAAVVLAAMGVYSVTAYAVSRRTHEIGVRMALGAQRTDVLRLVMQNGSFLILLGVAIGVTVGLALAHVMTSLLYEVSATDAQTFVVIALLLFTIALIAACLPARRAVRVDPIKALRCE
jgi:putative ABC transport system permease protein